MPRRPLRFLCPVSLEGFTVDAQGYTATVATYDGADCLAITVEHAVAQQVAGGVDPDPRACVVAALRVARAVGTTELRDRAVRQVWREARG